MITATLRARPGTRWFKDAGNANYEIESHSLAQFVDCDGRAVVDSSSSFTVVFYRRFCGVRAGECPDATLSENHQRRTGALGCGGVYQYRGGQLLDHLCCRHRGFPDGRHEKPGGV